MSQSSNPFPGDPDRSQIWQMLVPRDIRAFVAADWSLVEPDFLSLGFSGLHAHGSTDPDDWTLAFPSLEDYRDEWLRQAAETARTVFVEPLEAAIHRATRLETIDITGQTAVARKKFDGSIRRADGTADRLDWQTLYLCRKVEGRWKIAGFVGYLANGRLPNETSQTRKM